MRSEKLRRRIRDGAELAGAWVVTGGLVLVSAHAAGRMIVGDSWVWLIPFGLGWAGAIFLLLVGPIPRRFTDKSD